MCVYSNYSLMFGASSLREIADAASSMGYDSLAVTDRNNLYGMVRFLAEARSLGLRPVVGSELAWGEGAGARRAVMLACGRPGYESLCRTITRRMLDGGAFSFADALGLCSGVHVLAPFRDVLETAARALGPGFAWAAVERPGMPQAVQRSLFEAAARLGAGVVAVSPAAFHDSSRHGVHVTLAAAGARALRADRGAFAEAGSQARLRSPSEMAALFADAPEALENTLRVAEQCVPDVPSGSPIFPDFSGSGGEPAAVRLRRLCLEGLARRYGGVSGPPRERLERELGVIEKLGFPSYFLTVAEIVGYAREMSIPVVGRGSGASSIVAYSLGVTNVDPLRFGLCFERFLHEKRKDLPDLDVDLCWLGRDEVIDFAYRRFGRGRVAMICTHNALRPRSAFREAARAFGVPPEEVDRISRLIPHSAASLADALDGPRMRSVDLAAEPMRSIVEHAGTIEGFPRHLGIHSGGVVIGDRPLDCYVPLERSAKGIVVTQFEMRAIEAVGLVKFDLLGNRALTTIRHALGTARGMGFPVKRVEDLPESDEAASALIGQGRTLGCFQIESPAMRNLLRQIGATGCDGVIDALSLVRPGPAAAGMKEKYVRRSRGVEHVEHIHPFLAPVLESRHGILLYEEDVIAAAAAVGGMSNADADALRRKIKKGGGRLEEAEKEFMAAAAANGQSAGAAAAVWEHMARFAAYSFCRAHAAGYGVLAFQSAYLKARCPAAFFSSLMNNHAGMYPKRVHLEEARRMGVGILPPCVNRSEWGFTVEPAEGEPPAGTLASGPLRVGLSRVRGLRRPTFSALAAERAGRPFSSLSDFQSRVPASAPELEALVAAGAFSFAGLSRPDLMLALRCGPGAAGRAGDGLFRGEAVPAEAAAGLPEFAPWELARREYEVLGLFVSAHPVGVLRPSLGGCVAARDAPAFAGSPVRVCGIVSAGRRARTRNNETMSFVTLEDETGLVECTVFPAAASKIRVSMDGPGPYVASGVMEDRLGASTLDVRSVERPAVPGEPLGRRW